MTKASIDLATERETYCEMFGIAPDSVDDQSIHSFFVAHAKEHLELLKAGYLQMAEINEKICHDFDECEADCEQHVLERY